MSVNVCFSGIVIAFEDSSSTKPVHLYNNYSFRKLQPLQYVNQYVNLLNNYPSCQSLTAQTPTLFSVILSSALDSSLAGRLPQRTKKALVLDNQYLIMILRKSCP